MPIPVSIRNRLAPKRSGAVELRGSGLEEYRTVIVRGMSRKQSFFMFSFPKAMGDSFETRDLSWHKAGQFLKLIYAETKGRGIAHCGISWRKAFECDPACLVARYRPDEVPPVMTSLDLPQDT